VGGLDASLRHSISVSAEIVAPIETLMSSRPLTRCTKLPPEHELARVLKVSRVSLREAMHELEVKGVLERRRGRATTVVEPPPHARELYDVAELRETIEPMFAELAVERATGATVLALERALARSSREQVRTTRWRQTSVSTCSWRRAPRTRCWSPSTRGRTGGRPRRGCSRTRRRTRRSSQGHQLIFDAAARHDPRGEERDARAPRRRRGPHQRQFPVVLTGDVGHSW
jgi:DNA-binding transcriptional regulator YhcF (GntR family)